MLVLETFMTKKETTIVYFELINRLYSINYSSLRYYEQMKKQLESSDGFKFAMPLQKQESWIERKMQDINDLRSTYFEGYREANEMSRENFLVLDADLEKSKKLLLFIYNIWFEKECSFEDLFDGFLCKSPELLELLYIFEMKPFKTNESAIIHLANAYSSYIANLFYKTMTSSMKDIIDQLDNDFNSNGIPSIYRGIIKKNTVKKVSADQLKQIRKDVESFYNQLKSIKTKKYSGDAYTHSMATNKYLELDCFLEQVENRLKSANTDAMNFISNKIVEGTMDFLTGTPKVEKPVVSEIYVTDLELNYIEYLKEMLNFALASLKENKTQVEKQKGETQ